MHKQPIFDSVRGVNNIMIKFIKGDLIELTKQFKFDIVIHGCNIYHTMGAGIAKQIKENFPHVYEADKATEYGDLTKVGKWSFDVNKEIGLGGSKYCVIVNAYTQSAFSDGSNDVFSYDGFETILKDISDKCPHQSIGMPLIGCGLAGGNKERILEIIQDTIGHMDVTIVEWCK